MIVNRFILVCFGGILLASIFLFANFVNVTVLEWRHRDCPWWQCRPLILAGSLTAGALGLIGISSVRTFDGLEGYPLGGTWPDALFVSLALLWLSWTGFHWGATFEKRRVHWYAYVALVVAWIAFVTFLPEAARAHYP